MTRETYVRSATLPNLRTAISGHALTASGRTNSLTAEFLKRIFPTKTAAHVALLLGVKPRVARHRIEATRDFTIEEIATIILSEHGREWLAALMAGQKQPLWYRVAAPLLEVMDAQKQQLAARKKIARALKGAVDADTDLTAAIARADALLVHDEDFHRPTADALRSIGGVSHRAVAETASKKKRPVSL